MRRLYWSLISLALAGIITGIGLKYGPFQFTIGEGEEEDMDQPNQFQDYYTAITTRFDHNKPYPSGNRFLEFEKALKRQIMLKSGSEPLPWVSRGPYNVAGRVRSIVLDPTDNTRKTWFAGSASGGIWKTTDAGATWNNLTPGFPVLATTALAISLSNPDVIYAGTGEGFFGVGMVRGDGIYKSTDKGQTWSLINKTSNNPDFYFVNKILISPTNPDSVLVATNSGIFKSSNGGNSWVQTYKSSLRVQDLEADPTTFSTLYAGENSNGVLKSTDSGGHWYISSTGIGACLRVEIAVSPVNPSKVFACMETSASTTDVYISADKAVSWKKFSNSTTGFVNYLGDQGWFDNTLVCNPYDENTVFIGGIYLGKYNFTNTFSQSSAQVIRVDTIKTGSFLSFINFGGAFLGGGMQTGDKNGAVNLSASDWTPVEIRFGPGHHQKAHRFTVPANSGTNSDGGAGVPASSYIYQDYVDVPFEVWDTKNNRKLMASFRDQERDGAFNLITYNSGNTVSGREYIYVNAIPYADTPDTSIAKNGGHIQKQLYFFWPTLADSATWDPNNLPESKITVDYGSIALQSGTGTLVSDGRGDKGGVNSNLHADHHNLVVVPQDASTQKFWIIDANDGGVGLSQNSGETWTQLTNGMISTQFYGVDKKSGSDEFIGGMQDNGTWQSPIGATATSTSIYNSRIGGDGFEAVWHPAKTNQIIGSTYNNRFYLSRDGGKTWALANKNINDDGPFISRLGYSRDNPDVLFGVGKDGVWRSKTFGYYLVGGWEKIGISSGWALSEGVTNQHNVKVSLANYNVVWAGAGMYTNPLLSLFVSTDGGNTFNPTTVYNEVGMGYISGLATHPTNSNEAFALFSFNGAPKVIRTMDLGKTWHDISGFGTKDTSNNGFPNVAVHCLMVMPFDTTWIWVGTDIGLFESHDNGANWTYANNGLPAVSIWQIKTVDNEVVVATHGRGIWSTTIPGSTLNIGSVNSETFQLKVYPIPARDKIRISFSDPYLGNLRMQIYDLQGKLVFTKSMNKSAVEFFESIDVSDLSPGTYVLSVDIPNKHASQKIVIE